MVDWINIIRQCFRQEHVFVTRHAKREMERDEYGPISTEELVEAGTNAELLEDYPDDRPYPSALLLGFTRSGRPLHFVAAYSAAEGKLNIVTIYQPDQNRWIDMRERK